MQTPVDSLDLSKVIDILPQQKDLQAITDFLRNRSLMIDELKRLDAALTECAKQQDCYDERTGGLKGYRDGYRYKENKLTSTYLYEWARKNGFSESVSLNEGLDDQQFSAVLRQGSLFKDKALRGDFHGEWVHFIQWWCIVEYNKRLPFLTTPPAQLYRWIGQQSASPWFMTFELYGDNYGDNEESKNDFRSFQDLNDYLLSPQASQDVPVLHQVVKGRAKKDNSNAKLKLDLYLEHAHRNMPNDSSILEKLFDNTSTIQYFLDQHLKNSHFFKPTKIKLPTAKDYYYLYDKNNHITIPLIEIALDQFTQFLKQLIEKPADLNEAFIEWRAKASFDEQSQSSPKNKP